MALPLIPPYRLGPEVTSPPSRTDWVFDPDRAILLIHDMQHYFVDVFDREDPDAQINVAITHMTQLIEAARSARIPLIYTAQPPRQQQSDRGLLSDFWGAGLSTDESSRIIDPLCPQPADTVLTKWRYSAYYRTDLKERMCLDGRDQIVLAGIYAHIGCLTTALVAFMEDTKVFFVADAMADFGPTEHAMATGYVGQRCGQVVSTFSLIDSLSQAAGASL